MKSGWRNAALSGEECAMMQYVEKLTSHPGDMQQADVEALRAAGYEDVAILQINLIASWFNYINRAADGLGIGRR